MWLKSILFVYFIQLNLKLIESHGRLLDPPQRGSMWRFGFDVPPNYNGKPIFNIYKNILIKII